MIESEIITVITNIGFPAGMVIWFMLRTEKVIARNTDAFIRISEVVEKCQKK